MAEALKHYRVLMLDQRGTGLSTPINRYTLPERGAPEAQARYLRHFRAPDIVADAEAIRKGLDSEPGVTLGQSFGGFCTLTYLSFAPEGLAGSMITGGIPPLQGPLIRYCRQPISVCVLETRNIFVAIRRILKRSAQSISVSDRATSYCRMVHH